MSDEFESRRDDGRRAVERHVQQQVMAAQDVLDRVMHAMRHWHDALGNHDPIAAGHWSIEAGKWWQTAFRETQNAALLRRQADADLLRVDGDGAVAVGWPQITHGREG
ncbi:MAG TPA: hypothetical protein VFB58_09560 [Chloroflexota bacterium]|nr:hypothetical protein [Chloroflexota bacterium]